MSEKPITFTEEEQIKLRELEDQAQGFANWRNVVLRSLYAGQDATSVANLGQFLQNLALQSAQQIEEIKKQAQVRGTVSEVKQESKSEDKKLKKVKDA